jgi:hypothetical protein
VTSATLPEDVRLLIRLVCLAAAFIACTGPAPTLAPSPTSNLDATGILFVDVGEQVQTGPVSRRLANVYSDALQLAEDNGNDLGYPWVDPASNELVLSVVTPRGRELVEAAGITVPHRIREVAHGVTVLRGIQDDATFFNSRGVPGADLIFMTLPDHRDNRALIVISAMSQPLLQYLAETYPVDAIAVQVDPDGASLRGP